MNPTVPLHVSSSIHRNYLSKLPKSPIIPSWWRIWIYCLCVSFFFVRRLLFSLLFSSPFWKSGEHYELGKNFRDRFKNQKSVFIFTQPFTQCSTARIKINQQSEKDKKEKNCERYLLETSLETFFCLRFLFCKCSYHVLFMSQKSGIIRYSSCCFCNDRVLVFSNCQSTTVRGSRLPWSLRRR
jgi:hypothetical protein